MRTEPGFRARHPGAMSPAAIKVYVSWLVFDELVRLCELNRRHVHWSDLSPDTLSLFFAPGEIALIRSSAEPPELIPRLGTVIDVTDAETP